MGLRRHVSCHITLRVTLNVNVSIIRSMTSYAPFRQRRNADGLIFLPQQVIHPHLPVDALLGQEQVLDRKHDWLVERLNVAHSRARQYAEQKEAERLELVKDRVYCPPVKIGQLVYLRHWSQGRNKNQDAWSPIFYRVVEIQGSTHSQWRVGQ